MALAEPFTCPTEREKKQKQNRERNQAQARGERSGCTYVLPVGSIELVEGGAWEDVVEPDAGVAEERIKELVL